MKVLIITDQRELAEIIKKILKKHQSLVDIAYVMKIGIELSLSNDYQFIIIDVGTNNNAITFNHIRQQGIRTPMLALLAKPDLQIKKKCVDSGCDDYLVMPCNMEEIYLKMKTVLRRISQDSITYYKVTDVEFFTNQRMIKGQDNVEHLTKKETQLLELLIVNRNQVLSKLQIADRLWTNNQEFNENNIEVHISNIRKKLKLVSNLISIETIRHVGYSCRIND